MKNIGNLLLAGGFLAGAYATALDVQNVNWQLFVVAAFAALAGLIISKRQESAHARSDSVLEVNRGELRESIQNIVDDLNELFNSAILSDDTRFEETGATSGGTGRVFWDGATQTVFFKSEFVGLNPSQVEFIRSLYLDIEVFSRELTGPQHREDSKIIYRTIITELGESFELTRIQIGTLACVPPPILDRTRHL